MIAEASRIAAGSPTSPAEGHRDDQPRDGLLRGALPPAAGQDQERIPPATRALGSIVIHAR